MSEVKKNVLSVDFDDICGMDAREDWSQSERDVWFLLTCLRDCDQSKTLGDFFKDNPHFDFDTLSRWYACKVGVPYMIDRLLGCNDGKGSPVSSVNRFR